MRRSILLATISLGSSTLYRFVSGSGVSERAVVGSGLALVLLSIFGTFPLLAPLVDTFAYMLVVVIAVNDGLQLLGGL
jgi:hypothetical protein